MIDFNFALSAVVALSERVSKALIDNAIRMARDGGSELSARNTILEEIYFGLLRAEVNLKKLIEIEKGG